MATIVTNYILSAFGYEEARLGALCAVIASTVNPADYSSIKVQINDADDVCVTATGNALVSGQSATDITSSVNYQGKGICRMIKSGDLCITLRSVDYVFNNRGIGIGSNSLGYRILLMKIDESVSTIPWSGNKTTRSAFDEDSSVTGGTDIYITGMSARDEFANQALRGILSRIDDPFSLSDNEIAYYCAAAYKWASVMMLVAANSRENTSTSAPTAATVTSLDSNIERLLNNILVSITNNSSSGGAGGTVSVQNAENSNNQPIPLEISGSTTVTLNNGNNAPIYVSIVDNS